MPFKKFRFQQDNKEITSSSLSLPSSPTVFPRIWKHHVFPSFHGSDVRKNFLSHILVSFRRKGIDPFTDNHIERSKSIGLELIEAIRASKIAIVLLSKNYASSSWCLDELAEILNCREVLGQIVMPIFYEVDPTDIRKQTREFGRAFRKSCKGKTKEHIEIWRKALEDVAKIAGEHSCNWENDAAMIEKIATDVSNMLNISTPSKDFNGMVGMKVHIEEMKQLLCLDLDEVRMIGIWGPPGIGKTTIARVLFSQTSSRFQLGAIMVNIKGCYPRPCLDEYDAQLQLQNRMLSQIINQKDIMISHLGVAQERLKDKKVLLILDDVDQTGQLIALAKETGWFGPGSRIIITTEDLRVLKAHRIEHIYKVKYPSSEEAFQIFCMYAFGKEYPEDGFYELACEVTDLAGELPLGLKVLGSALQGMSKQEWRRTLPMLKIRLNGEIESIIKFSYDALSDEEKDLFLYLACFFNNEKAHKVEEFLAHKFSDVRQSLHILVEKSFISSIDNEGNSFVPIDYNEWIRVHTLLENFGRETSRKKYVHGIAKRRLLVNARDICDDTIDSRKFIGIQLVVSKNEEELNISEKAVERMSDLQFVSIIDHRNGFGSCERLHSILSHSQKIRYLQWNHFQNKSLPSTFNPEYLIELVMTYSKLQKLWEGNKPLKNLKWMNLLYSKDLKELPDLSTATNLKSLILVHCSNLVELPTIGDAIKLEILDLDSCSNLVKLPSYINATNLKSLTLRKCSSVVKLPAIDNAINLQSLSLFNCSSLVELSPSIGTATKLEILNISRCSNLVKLPSSIGDMNCLQVFNLSNCSSLVELPSSIGDITNLQKLDVSVCSSLKKLPSSIGDFTKLRVFNLSKCSSLMEIPHSIGTATNLQELDISGCSSLVKLPSSIGDITCLREFDLSNCSSLMELPPIGPATNIEKLYISGCTSLVKLSFAIGDITCLKEFCLCNCLSLVELPSFIRTSTNIEKLDISGRSSLMKLPSSIGDISSLGVLNLSNCSSLLELPPSIGTATNLQNLDISGCSSLVKLPSSIGDITNLYIFNLHNCSSLVELPSSIGDITNLQVLDISGCSSFVKLPSSIGDISSLRKFNLNNCSSLLELPSSIGNLQHLAELRICGCSKLQTLPTNINLKSLNKLDLRGCTQLNKFPEISTNIKYLALEGTAVKEVPLSILSWSRLSNFHMSYFENLQKFPHALGIITELVLVSEDIHEVAPWVKGMSHLHALRLYDCNNLVSLPQLSDSLTCIDADNCKSLERLDCSFSNPEICLIFTNCFKLNQKARDLIMCTSTNKYVVLPGRQMPTCFNHRATTGGSLTIKLNKTSRPTSLRFKACIMLVNDKDKTRYDDESSRSVGIFVIVKHTYLWVNRPMTDHIYTFEVEVSEVTSTKLIFKFETDSIKWKVGECGLVQILEVPSC